MESSNESPSASIRESTNVGAPHRSLLTIHEAPEAAPLGCSNGLEEFGTAFAKPGGYISKDIDMLWPAVTDEIGDYQVLIAPHYLPRPPTPRVPVPEIDGVYAAEASLRRVLALASVVGLPRQIEREEANMVRRPQMPSLVTQGRVATLTVLGNRAGVGEPIFGSDVEEHVPAGPSK